MYCGSIYFVKMTQMCKVCGRGSMDAMNSLNNSLKHKLQETERLLKIRERDAKRARLCSSTTNRASNSEKSVPSVVVADLINLSICD